MKLALLFVCASLSPRCAKRSKRDRERSGARRGDRRDGGQDQIYRVRMNNPKRTRINTRQAAERPARRLCSVPRA